MALRQRDYILRMIEQFANAIARIAGLKVAGQLDEADRLIRETADGIFGPLRSMLDQVDSGSAATLIDDHEKIGIYAALCAERANLLELRGEVAGGRAERRRALELHLEAARRSPEVCDRDRDAIRELRDKVDRSRLSPRHRSLLDELG